MAVNEPHTAPRLEDILSSAVERQISEQEALRQSLTHIEDGVRAIREDMSGHSEAIAASVLESLQAVRARLERSAPDILREDLREVRDLLEERIGRLPDALFRGVRDALAPQFGVPEELRDRLDGLRTSMDTRGEEVETLARSVLELSSGVRKWAEGIEERVESLAESLSEGLRDLGAVQEESLEATAQRVASSVSLLGEEVARLVRETVEPLESRLGGLEERLEEAGELSRYLHDQVEDLDRVLGGIGDVPERLEGVVSQALRRALTVRAGLTRDAERALERTIGPVETNLERLVESLEGVADLWQEGHISDDLRKLSLRQVELTSRLEELQETLVGSLQAAEEERRERDEALAAAIDRLADGRGPEAVRGLSDAIRGSGRTRARTDKKATARSSKTKAKTTKTKTKAKTTKTKAKPRGAKATKGRSSQSRASQGGKKRSSQGGRAGSPARGSRRTSAQPTRRRSRRTTTRTTNFIPV